MNGKTKNIRKEASTQHKHEAYNFSVFSYNVQVLKKYKYELTMHKYNIMSCNFFFHLGYIFKAIGEITLKYTNPTKMNRPHYFKWTDFKTV